MGHMPGRLSLAIPVRTEAALSIFREMPNKVSNRSFSPYANPGQENEAVPVWGFTITSTEQPDESNRAAAPMNVAISSGGTLYWAPILNTGKGPVSMK